jgi:uncharacterized protein with HEPN domain
MQPENRELAYLWDMREAAQEIVSFVANVNYSDFTNNKMIRYAVERQLLVIGEAANHVPGAYQENHPEIPWQQVIGLRNVLAHEYGEIKVDRIYNAATISVPNLLILLNKLLPTGE